MAGDRIALMFVRYLDIWDCCDMCGIPIFPLDSHIFQLRLTKAAQNHSLYGFVFEKNLMHVPVKWMARANVVVDLNTNECLRFRLSKTPLVRVQMAQVVEPLAKLAKEQRVYTGPLAVIERILR